MMDTEPGPFSVAAERLFGHAREALLAVPAGGRKNLPRLLGMPRNCGLLSFGIFDAKGNPFPAIAQHIAAIRLAVLDHSAYLRLAMPRHLSRIASISSKLRSRPVRLLRSKSESSISLRIRFCTSVFVVQLTLRY